MPYLTLLRTPNAPCVPWSSRRRCGCPCVLGFLASSLFCVAYAVIRQKRNDNRFVHRLRGQADTIILKNVRLVRESIGYHGCHYSTQQKCRELEARL